MKMFCLRTRTTTRLCCVPRPPVPWRWLPRLLDRLRWAVSRKPLHGRTPTLKATSSLRFVIIPPIVEHYAVLQSVCPSVCPMPWRGVHLHRWIVSQKPPHSYTDSEGSVTSEVFCDYSSHSGALCSAAVCLSVCLSRTMLHKWVVSQKPLHGRTLTMTATSLVRFVIIPSIVEHYAVLQSVCLSVRPVPWRGVLLHRLVVNQRPFHGLIPTLKVSSLLRFKDSDCYSNWWDPTCT